MFKTKSIEAMSGFAVLLVVIILSWIFFSKLRKFGYFTKNCYEIGAYFSDVDGLKVGDEVKIFGVNIGHISSVVLNTETYNPMLSMCIDSKYSIPIDSSATILSFNFLGKKYISISPGNDKSTLSPGDYIEYTQSEMTLNSLVGKVINKLLNK